MLHIENPKKPKNRLPLLYIPLWLKWGGVEITARETEVFGLNKLHIYRTE
jgi:hypothetical protein